MLQTVQPGWIPPPVVGSGLLIDNLEALGFDYLLSLGRCAPMGLLCRSQAAPGIHCVEGRQVATRLAECPHGSV